MVLVMLGITCLILELKMPGVGLPGVVAAICFVLFFWSHSQLHGQITWLAILLFVLGLLLIGLEVFVLPGFGVAGISGMLLVLAASAWWPTATGRAATEWVGFGQQDRAVRHQHARRPGRRWSSSSATCRTSRSPTG